MAFPFGKLAGHEQNLAVETENLLERSIVAVKFSYKEDSWILLENLSVPGIFSLGFSYFGSIEKDEQN